ncbi:MAG: DegV family protein [Anaerolineaceae bacterium]|nr:DegV family protein [Anaerolineaceae bacterium]
MTINSLCIVTDSSAQFIDSIDQYQNQLSVFPLSVQLYGVEADQQTLVKDLHRFANDRLHPHIQAPTVEVLRKHFLKLFRDFNEILCIFLSSRLSACVENATKAAESIPGGVSVQVIDSQTTSLGLGFLVRLALEVAAQGNSINVIEKRVRGQIPHLYSVLCTPGLSYLYHNGFVDHAQASITEMMELYPIFGIEDGRMTPLDKVRTRRHVFSYFQEYLTEFDKLNQIALLLNNSHNSPDLQAFREYLAELFPDTPMMTHPTNLPVATLFGPGSLGLFLLEKTR